MKKCYTCQKYKTPKDFNKNKGRADGLNSICKECSRARSKQYYKENTSKHKEVVTDRKWEQVKKNRIFTFQYLSQHPCGCGEGDPAALDFNHLRDKRKEISKMVGGGCSIATIKAEIAKCEVLCANCHRKKTAKEYGWYKDLMGPVAQLAEQETSKIGVPTGKPVE